MAPLWERVEIPDNATSISTTIKSCLTRLDAVSHSDTNAVTATLPTGLATGLFRGARRHPTRVRKYKPPFSKSRIPIAVQHPRVSANPAFELPILSASSGSIIGMTHSTSKSLPHCPKDGVHFKRVASSPSHSGICTSIRPMQAA